MRAEDLARACKALGDPTRARIFQFLLDCCQQVAVEEDGDVRPVCGPTVGAVCCHITGIDRATSTISFHLKELREAGLITMEKRGKQMLCSVDSLMVAALAAYFADAARKT